MPPQPGAGRGAGRYPGVCDEPQRRVRRCQHRARNRPAMTPPAAVASPGHGGRLNAAAVAAGLTVSSSASWPETEADGEVTALAGFIESNFSPLVAEVAGRVLRSRDQSQASGKVTAIVIVTALGDVTSATRVAAA